MRIFIPMLVFVVICLCFLIDWDIVMAIVSNFHVAGYSMIFTMVTCAVIVMLSAVFFIFVLIDLLIAWRYRVVRFLADSVRQKEND